MRTSLRYRWLPSATLLMLAPALVIGCRGPSLTDATRYEANPPGGVRHDASIAATNSAHGPPKEIDAAAMAGVMDKLDQVRELDPDAAPRLLAELQDTPPQFWPSAAEQFRASLAYHQQLVARRMPGRDDPVIASAATESSPPVDDRKSPALPAEHPHATAQERDPTALSASAAAVQPSPSSQPLAAPVDHHVAQASFDASERAAPVAKRDWRELLALATDDLTRTVPPAPASTAEIHQHAALRLLRLVEGDTERALEPIPRLSPIEQDYWSRQLFALAMYLDHHGQPDDHRRAAAAAIHLDEALAHLRDVGALSLQNLTFCKKIYGFGVYEPYEPAKFMPGQQVALYVELENHHSRSTEEGFATLLASSYEIVDHQNERIAGDLFPDVNDVCRSRRRDFHIQYGLRLPAAIKPGRYHLKLVVRDRQGDKIGSAAAAFEVMGARGHESGIEGQTKATKSQEVNATQEANVKEDESGS